MLAGEFSLAKTGEPQKISAPIVVRATGQVSREVKVGKPLPNQSAFGLARGDVLSLLDFKGVRVLRGPGVLTRGVFTQTGSPEGDGSRIAGVADASSALAAPIAGSGPQSRTRTAANRTRAAEDYIAELSGVPQRGNKDRRRKGSAFPGLRLL
jgi:hypothetical protein